jgi:hypothetical protein
MYTVRIAWAERHPSVQTIVVSHRASNELSSAAEQCAKTLLLEMAVGRKNIREPFTPHGSHGNTVGHAVCLVGTITIKLKTQHEGGAAFGNDLDIRIAEHCSYRATSAIAPMRIAREEGQKFGKDRIYANDFRVRDLLCAGDHRFVRGICRVRQSNPVERIRKDSPH